MRGLRPVYRYVKNTVKSPLEISAGHILRESTDRSFMSCPDVVRYGIPSSQDARKKLQKETSPISLKADCHGRNFIYLASGIYC